MLKTAKDLITNTNSGIDSFLGHNTNFQGTLIFEGLIRIDGVFSGNINTNDVLIIAESGNVNATIEAGVIKISGRFDGVLKAKNKVELYRPAYVTGTIITPSLRIEDGVIFNGKTEMAPLPTDEG